LPAPREVATAPAVSRDDFVGADRCAQCHAAEYGAWKPSTHGRAGGTPSSTTVVAPFGNSVIAFANARVTPRIRVGIYEFVVERAGDSVRVFRVDAVLGGAHIFGGGTQGFVTRADDGTVRFLPFEWSRHAASWFCNTNSRSGKGWTPITPTMRLEECSDWPPMRVVGDNPRFTNCQSCHASQATLAVDTVRRRYDTRVASMDINCESCHGPGRRHVQLATTGALRNSADVGFVALDALDKDASSGVCYQCHAVKDRLRDGFVSGERLAIYYSTKFPLLGDRPLTPDGRVRTFAYQEGQQYSDCYLNGGMTCTSCHDPHSQTYRTVTGEALRDRFDDRQCTSCHTSKADNPPAHTKHKAATVRCTSCHMPARQEPATRAATSNARVVLYARSDHSISIPRPALDSALGLVTACSACHQAMPVAQQQRQIRAWWGDIKPMPAEVAAQLTALAQPSVSESSALLLADTASSARHTFAQFAGASRFLETRVRPDGGLDAAADMRLHALARSHDVDVRAAALAALHLASGSERGTRRMLASALRAEGDHDLAVRSRWAIALGYMGDRFAATGDPAAALTAYDRALDVRPSSPALLMSRANAQRDAGDLTGAIASYQSSLAIDRSNSLAWVNFGIALATAGDTTAAVTALTNAATVDPSEPLAWFNLGNIAFVRGNLVRADSLYQRAAALNPSIALAQFQLARVSLMKKEYASALLYLRRGLAFDSSDASARQTAAELSKRLDPGTARPQGVAKSHK
ncbi:MAG TPA: tetratricopeptide repeat protein, partial [Gemmatimonadaceae bacterium]|nr:tetratricopeptide repeat protein [Gemmatimonadaceae bacterium]